MKTTTLNTNALEAESFRELTAGEMDDVTGGLFGGFFQRAWEDATLASDIANGISNVVNGLNNNFAKTGSIF